MTGKELKMKIEQLGVTQRSLAEKMNVTPQTISAIMSAKDIRTSSLEKIAQIVDRPIGYFYDEIDEAKNAIANGAGSVAAIQSTVNQTKDSLILEERIKGLEFVLQEKERLIKILMQK